jgi:hypothetical protein
VKDFLECIGAIALIAVLACAYWAFFAHLGAMVGLVKPMLGHLTALSALLLATTIVYYSASMTWVLKAWERSASSRPDLGFVGGLLYLALSVIWAALFCRVQDETGLMNFPGVTSGICAVMCMVFAGLFSVPAAFMLTGRGWNALQLKLWIRFGLRLS